MNKYIMFALGAATGSLVTWYVIDKKYKKYADEEIAEMAEYYREKLDNMNELAKDAEEDKRVIHSGRYPWGMNFDEVAQKEEIDQAKEKYEDIVTMYAEGEKVFEERINEDGIVKVEELKENNKPFVISPEEYGELGNQQRSLTYYSDFVLVDEDDDIILDPESLIGDALEHFGEYEDDSVHVRNEQLEIDFEILKSEKSFSEINKEDN